MKRLHIPMIFRDSEAIYLEFPAIPNGPQGFVRRFRIAEGGLSLLKLSDIPSIEQHPGYTASAARVLAAQERKVLVAKRSSTGPKGKRVPRRYAKQESKEFLQKLGLTRKA